MSMISGWGIDVSAYDAKQYSGALRPMDWVTARINGGITTAIIKASEGANYIDPAFLRQWQAAKDAGTQRVAYHFFRNNQDAVAQANLFKSILTNDFTPSDFIAVDFETQDGMLGSHCLSAVYLFLTEMKKTHPVDHMLLYTYPAFWQTIGGANATWAAEYKLWIAQWPKDTWILNFPINIFDAAGLASLKQQIVNGILLPPVVKPWASPAIWQFTARADTRAIPGYVGFKKVCDYNVVYPSLGDEPTPPPTPPVNPSPVYPKYITTVNVNVRNGPLDTDPIIKVLIKGTTVTTDIPTQTSATRTHILTPLTGWIYSAYLNKL